MSTLDGIALRAATGADLPTCEAIWRDGLNDYLLPLGQMEIPPDNPSVRGLHAHLLETDPDLFRVATARAWSSSSASLPPFDEGRSGSCPCSSSDPVRS